MHATAKMISKHAPHQQPAPIRPAWDRGETPSASQWSSRRAWLLAWEFPSAGWLSGLSHTIVICLEMCACLLPHAIPQFSGEEHTCHHTVCWPHYMLFLWWCGPCLSALRLIGKTLVTLSESEDPFLSISPSLLSFTLLLLSLHLSGISLSPFPPFCHPKTIPTTVNRLSLDTVSFMIWNRRYTRDKLCHLETNANRNVKIQ